MNYVRNRDKPWYFGDNLVTGPKYIALGRRNWYSEFSNRLTRLLNTKVYLCDFMTWIDEAKPEKSLNYFIESAERIDINLRGLSAQDLYKATAGASRRAIGKSELRVSYMSCWEINQVYHGDYLRNTHWHVPGQLQKEEVKRILGESVTADTIHDYSEEVTDELGAKEIPTEQLIAYYSKENRKPMVKLIEKVIHDYGTNRFRFLDGYGTLVIAADWGSSFVLIEITEINNDTYVIQLHKNQEVVSWSRGISFLNLEHLLKQLAR